MLKSKYNWLLTLLILPLLWSCQEDEEATALPTEITLIDTTFQTMKDWYLWNAEMPNINPDDYETADALINALRNPLDKWSYIEEEEAYDDFFNNAQYEGYGFRWAFDEEDKLRIAFAYGDSPFGRLGVDRSWTINKVNGRDVASIMATSSVNQAIAEPTNTFEFTDDEGNIITETLTKETIGINTVLHHQIFDLDGTKVGYLVFNSFLATSIDELKPVFQEFNQAGIDELILDLRYNGGGRVNVAEYMAANIAGNKVNGRNFIEYIFNEQQLKQNQEVTFNQPDYPLNLDRLVTITSKSTASASELVINGLAPFMDVVVIGENTHGKPVGSFPFRFGGYAINPISFKIANDNGEGEYFQGFAPDAFVPDDLTHKFGDPQESRLQEALYYIENGLFLNGTARLQPSTSKYQIEWSGFRQEIGAY
ncbi:S41 family peptidase [Tunicatimonas pelagia]|uniref:S41 family peptidase n=1 Tax=Tunicatimonas pelagia TaxID=931531 RepID=UPI002664EE2E|nr:S41 family peptidase [Tunicatimonas pelagia]WKN42727.1 S41 family peptidase [Tunicatimonas pelagia]